jgi:hypothetical protein
VSSAAVSHPSLQEKLVHAFPIRRAGGTTIALALTLVSCSKADRPSSESAAADAAATSRAPAGAPRSARVYPGALTKSIDAYTGDEFYELTRGLRYVGSHERQRKCRNAAGCDAANSTRRTLVQVSAVATQDSVGAGDVPEFGVVYVRAINRGDAEEARYGMRPGRTLRYYAIVQRDSAGGLGWRLEELETAPPRRHARIASGRINGCGHPWTPGARADFRSCTTPEGQDTVVTLPLLLQGAVDDPIWSQCDMGCCQFR